MRIVEDQVYDTILCYKCNTITEDFRSFFYVALADIYMIGLTNVGVRSGN